MAKNQPRYLPLESSHISELHALAQRGSGFFHICGSEVPSIIPSGLKQTWASAVVINSATAGSMAIIGHRIDQNAGMMDHHPFVIRVSGLTPYGEGVLIEHAAF